LLANGEKMNYKKVRIIAGLIFYTLFAFMIITSLIYKKWESLIIAISGALCYWIITYRRLKRGGEKGGFK